MITIKAAMTDEVTGIRQETIDAVVKWFDAQHERFKQGALIVHRKSVFEILRVLLQFTPVVTGRLRGSWTPYFDHYNKNGAYARAMAETAMSRAAGMVRKAATAAKNLLGRDAISQGKRKGFWREGAGGFLTTIGSNVVYADSANQSSKYLTKTARVGDRIILANFTAYLEMAKNMKWIPEASDLTDDPGKPGQL